MTSLLQNQYDKIYAFFQHTSEPFDFLEWDGYVLQVWFGDNVLEKYSSKELINFGVLF